MSQVPTSGAVPQEPTVHHKARHARRTERTVPMSLNLTSMIDVIFLLLVFFVVTASFAPGEGILTAKLPQGTGTGDPLDPPTLPLNIAITPTGAYGYRLEIEGLAAVPADFEHLYHQLVSLQYNEALQRTGTHKTDDPIVIMPTGDVRWQHVVNAFNAAIRARYTKIAFAQAQDGGDR